MENTLLWFIPKPIAFRSQPFSPRKFKSQAKKGFSGQITPQVSCRKTEEDEKEPTSPKISCIGQIKHKNWERKNKKLIEGPKTKASSLRAFFSLSHENESCALRPQNKVSEKGTRETNFGKIRGFMSGHNKVAGFDWRTHVAPMTMKHRNTYSSKEDIEEENDIKVPFSAPAIMGGLGGNGNKNMDLKPRKEINLWKRRTMAQPQPLQVAPLR